MNEPDYFDYKSPIGAQNDYRTSTYRGHLKVPQQVSWPIAHNFSDEFTKHIQSSGEQQQRFTENQDQFPWKVFHNSTVRNPAVNQVQLLKPLEESLFRNAPKPIPTASSVSREDYQWKSKVPEGDPPAIQFPTELQENKHLIIDRRKPGYGKLLDPSATTNSLTYKAFATEELLGLASKDHITFWNCKDVFEKEQPTCSVPNKCSLRRREYHNPVKHVPHGGLISEAKSSYVPHSNCTHSHHVNNRLISYSGEPNKAVSENTIYGSGTRLQKYIA